jgi:putative cardiolipin synthase
MHNKSFTADNQVTIIGGRNVGDEYFGATSGVLFSDLDVMAIGPAVKAVSNDFDRYWNSASSYPLNLIVAPPDQDGSADVRRSAAALEHTPEARAYQVAMGKSTFVSELVARKLPLEWATARLVSDDPAKALGRAAPDSRLIPQLKELLGAPARELDVVSAYFVPGKSGTEALSALARSGVAVRVLTNSLEATDVPAVHAGYAGWRKPLLASGVKLFEMRSTWAEDEPQPRRRSSGSFGSSSSSLHAKTFAVDGERLFIGSFNLDPRSARLNTEMGFVIDSPVLARQLASQMKGRVLERAYEVRLSPEGALYWIERKDGVAIRYDTEPRASFWRRVETRILSWLPIEWLL